MTTTFYWQEQPVEAGPHETVLDALLRQGHKIPSGCRSGVCQSCLIKVEGAVPVAAQSGLSDGHIADNLALACQCRAISGLRTGPPGIHAARVLARVTDKRWLAPNIIGLRLAANLRYRPGQYVTLWRDEHTSRSYSIASHPDIQDTLEFHIRVHEQGRFSRWVAEGLKVGDLLPVQGPMGHCIYKGESSRPLLMVAMGTGLAPLFGVLQDALMQGHSGDIHLVVAAMQAREFYLTETLLELAGRYPQLKLHWVVSTTEDLAGCHLPLVRAGVEEYVTNCFPDLNGFGVYLCGAPRRVHALRRGCYIAGAAMIDIAADAFLTCDRGELVGARLAGH
ncbi:MAG: hypothetical protein D6758_02520 [Gammaproteobacteria bacterium]|nr:MAG: hypothetical protein D6758_02520 [Gammaproteobacteria bacterium]